jgi:GNAT superfamily N-acetyltransferase
MSIEIHRCPPERFTEMLKTAEIGFSDDVPDDLLARVELVADKERWFAPFDGERIVGTSGVFSLRLSVPGGELATGAITWVTVLPSHRRRGLMTSAASRWRRSGRPRPPSTSASGLGWQRRASTWRPKRRRSGLPASGPARARAG